MSLIVKCKACRKMLRAPVRFAGRRVRCQCGERITVPPLASGRQAAAPQGLDLETPTDLRPAEISDIAQLADGETEAAHTCRKCRASMALDAVFCIQCGFDERTGRTVREAADSAADSKSSATANPKTVKSSAEGSQPDGAPGRFSTALSVLAKPLLILGVVGALLFGAWYIKDAIFFDPSEQCERDQKLVTIGMDVNRVVAVLGKKPSLIEAVRPQSMAKDKLGRLIPRKLAYQDDFVHAYSKEDLEFGFTFVYRYSERNELRIDFDPGGNVLSAEAIDPFAVLGL